MAVLPACVSGVVLLCIMGNTNQFQRQGSVAVVEALMVCRAGNSVSVTQMKALSMRNDTNIGSRLDLKHVIASVLLSCVNL